MSFIINKSEFTPCFENKNKLTVTSHPENYDVVFESASLNFTDKDVVLVDSKTLNHRECINGDNSPF